MFGDHGLCGLPEEGAHEKSPKCLGGNLGDFGGILQRSLPISVPATLAAKSPKIFFSPSSKEDEYRHHMAI